MYGALFYRTGVTGMLQRGRRRLRQLERDSKARRIAEWGIVALVAGCIAVVVGAYLSEAADAPFFR